MRTLEREGYPGEESRLASLVLAVNRNAGRLGSGENRHIAYRVGGARREGLENAGISR